MTPSFCSLTDTKQSLQYTIKTHLSGPPMPKFEANMNYILPSPPSSMKQCNKSATVKFHMELLLTTTTRKQSRSGATPTELGKTGYVHNKMPEFAVLGGFFFYITTLEVFILFFESGSSVSYRDKVALLLLLLF